MTQQQLIDNCIANAIAYREAQGSLACTFEQDNITVTATAEGVTLWIDGVETPLEAAR